MERLNRPAASSGAASEENLIKLVFSGNPTILSGLLERPDLNDKVLVLLLRNPALPVTALERICREKIFLSSYQVQAALTQNPKTPDLYALRFLPGLFWKDQLLVARNFRISTVRRRKAEKAIVDHLRKMAIGEKMELARMATTEVLKSVVLDDDPRILTACLQNPRATVDTATRLIRSDRVQASFLLAIAQMPRWFVLYDVKLALAHAARSPVPLVLRVLPFLKLNDLKMLSTDRSQPEVIVQQAREIVGFKQEEACS